MKHHLNHSPATIIMAIAALKTFFGFYAFLQYAWSLSSTKKALRILQFYRTHKALLLADYGAVGGSWSEYYSNLIPVED